TYSQWGITRLGTTFPSPLVPANGATRPRALAGSTTRLRFAHRLDGPGTFFADQHDGTSLVTQGRPHLIPQVFLVRIRKQAGPIDEEEERRRSLSYLRGVIKLEPVSMRTDGLPALHRGVQGSIQDRCRNLLLQLRRDIAHGLQKSIQVEPGPGRREHHWGVVEKEEVFLNPLTEFTERGHRVILAVPP